MSRLLQAVANRDASTLSQIAGNYPDKPTQNVVNSEAEHLVDALFRQFRQVFPAAAATNLRTQADESAAKKQWIAAFAENGITTREQLAAGMRWARAKDTPFMPSPGQFIEQCKVSDLVAAGIPGEAELYEMFRLYCRDRGVMGGCDNYPWESSACFHIITAVYGQMHSFNLADSECRKRLNDEARKVSRRIKAGEVLPEPRKQIPQRHIPSEPDVAMSHIANMKQMIKNSRHN